MLIPFAPLVFFLPLLILMAIFLAPLDSHEEYSSCPEPTVLVIEVPPAPPAPPPIEFATTPCPAVPPPSDALTDDFAARSLLAAECLRHRDHRPEATAAYRQVIHNGTAHQHAIAFTGLYQLGISLALNDPYTACGVLSQTDECGALYGCTNSRGANLVVGHNRGEAAAIAAGHGRYEDHIGTAWVSLTHVDEAYSQTCTVVYADACSGLVATVCESNAPTGQGRLTLDDGSVVHVVETWLDEEGC